MNKKDEFKRQLIEKWIFNKEKDKALICAQNIKNKYINYDIDYSNLYAKLVNYQIKKYGRPLSNPKVVINLYFDKKKGLL